MSLIQRLFGGSKPPSYEASRMQSQLNSGSSQQFANSQGGTRRELLRVVLRETLHRQGIPVDWVGGEALATTSRDGSRGVHWRLLIKHWDERLLAHTIALQHALIKRVTTFDPMASQWLNGISWQFALPDESVCPALPHPGSWTAEKRAAAGPLPDQGGIIEGPVHIAETPAPPTETDAARADLEQLLAIRDADFRRHSDETGPSWSATEPAKL